LKGEKKMAKSFDVASLQSLVGKGVRVYKAGPESKRGRLIAVMENYILLEAENDGLVYYNTEHIRSVAEDIQAPTPTYNRPDDFYDRYIMGEGINDVLNNLKYSLIKVDRGGPESRMGRLLGVGDDFFVLYTKEDGIVYYQTQHVKSITVETNNNNKILEEYPEYLEGSALAEIFGKAETRWVKINRGGPESVEGILVATLDDHIILVNNKEVYRVANFHIKNFSVMDPNAKNNNNQENNNNANAAEAEASRSSSHSSTDAVGKSSSEKKKKSEKQKVTASSRSSRTKKRYSTRMVVQRRSKGKTTGSRSSAVKGAWRPSRSFKGMMVPKNKKK
jgi:spore coat protein B